MSDNRFLVGRIIVILFLCLGYIDSSGQFFKKNKFQKSDSQKKLVIPKGDFVNLTFPNVNSQVDYFDREAYDKIKKLERSKKWRELYPLLKDYVQKFSIRNFYVDSELLWRLAKLTEVFGTEDEAYRLYKLALRHHHPEVDMKKLELFYDSLNNQETNSFVPLDYYYQLVESRKAIDTISPPRGVLLNMGRNINTIAADYAPALANNDNSLIFTSNRNEYDKNFQLKKNEDLFISKKDIDGFWSLSVDMEGINTEFNEGSACLTKDGKTLFFSRCNSPNSMGNCDIFMAILDEDSTWREVHNLGVNVNSLAWDSHPSLSHSEDTLYFASDRIGGFGLSDIYYTHKSKSGAWLPAKNAGPVVNTRGNEVSPFYHPKYDILYFSSNGQLFSFGEFDIYKSYHENEQWSEPINIGPLVNGAGSEFYFTIDKNSKDLFYARSAIRDISKLDLYSFPMPMEAKPDANTKFSGSLMDSVTGKPFTGIVSIIDLDEGVAVAPKYLKPDGTFEFDLINNRNYLMVIQGDDFFRIEEMFYLQGPKKFEEVTDHISSRVKFESIEFDPGKALLKNEMYADLNKVINFMYDNPDFFIRISGHTDKSGNESVNLRLSKERANVIRDYIVLFGGVNGDRVEADGFGSQKPLVEEDDEENQNLNRRVEFEIFRPAKPIKEKSRDELSDEDFE